MVAPTTPAHPEPPPFVRIKGSHREMGRQLGEACREQVIHSLENARALIENGYDELQLTWEGAVIQASKYGPFTQERYPQYMQEIIGIAEGADVPLDDLTVLIGMEAVTMDALHLTKCTSMAVSGEHTADGHVLVAHNEDWLPEDEQDTIIIHATPDEEPPFLAMSYGGLLPNIGFNAAGIAQCCDSVYPNDSRIGIPRVVVSRAVLAPPAPKRPSAICWCRTAPPATTTCWCTKAGRCITWKSQPGASPSWLGWTAGWCTPTTTWTTDARDRAGPDELIATRVRYFRAQRLLSSTGSFHQVLKAIQRDHINYPNSICNHLDMTREPLNREKTINALIMDLTAGACISPGAIPARILITPFT
jgi:isopenicillin-N N-acyltransferase like protein